VSEGTRVVMISTATTRNEGSEGIYPAELSFYWDKNITVKCW